MLTIERANLETEEENRDNKQRDRGGEQRDNKQRDRGGEQRDNRQRGSVEGRHTEAALSS